MQMEASNTSNTSENSQILPFVFHLGTKVLTHHSCLNPTSCETMEFHLPAEKIISLTIPDPSGSTAEVEIKKQQKLEKQSTHMQECDGKTLNASILTLYTLWLLY